MYLSDEEHFKALEIETQRVNEHYKTAPDRFLEAWKRALRKVGRPELFYDASGSNRQVDIDGATHKSHLTPDFNKINQFIDVASHGEAVFLAVLYSFYNQDQADQLIDRCGNPSLAYLARRLHFDHLEILSELMLNHTGW